MWESVFAPYFLGTRVLSHGTSFALVHPTVPGAFWLSLCRTHALLSSSFRGALALCTPPAARASLMSVTILFFFLIEQERARLLRGQSVQQVGPQGLLYVQQRELAVTSPKDGRLGSSELGVLPKGCWILYFISFLLRLRLHSGF